MARWVALIGAIAGLAVSLPLYTFSSSCTVVCSLSNCMPWISRFNINYHLGVDGISMLFIVLNSFTHLAGGYCRLGGDRSAWQYMAAFLDHVRPDQRYLCRADAILFYVFSFEAMLIPMYLVIGVSGAAESRLCRDQVLPVYLIGSLLMLVAFILSVLSLGWQFQHFDFTICVLPIRGPGRAIAGYSFTIPAQTMLFAGVLRRFAVKVPMWPGTPGCRMPVEAPTGGSMVLAAITLKIGATVFCVSVCRSHRMPVCSCRFHGIPVTGCRGLYRLGCVGSGRHEEAGGIFSISHMGFVTLGLFMFAKGQLTTEGVGGALVRWFLHGFVSAAMFACIGVMYDRMHSRPDCRLRWCGQYHAEVRRIHAAVRDGQCRPAGHVRFRR